MANEAEKPSTTEAEIKNDLIELFREKGFEASDGLPGEIASILTDGIRLGFEKTVQAGISPKIKPEP